MRCYGKAAGGHCYHMPGVSTVLDYLKAEPSHLALVSDVPVEGAGFEFELGNLYYGNGPLRRGDVAVRRVESDVARQSARVEGHSHERGGRSGVDTDRGPPGLSTTHRRHQGYHVVEEAGVGDADALLGVHSPAIGVGPATDHRHS